MSFEAAYVTSDHRGVSWQEQELLTFGSADGAGAEPDPGGPEACPADAPGEGGSAADPASSFWSFGGAGGPAPRPEPQRGWSFGGPETAARRRAFAPVSRRF